MSARPDGAIDERLRPPRTVSMRHLAEPLRVQRPAPQGAGQRLGELLARSSRLIGVLEEIDDEPLGHRPARERDPAKDVAPAAELEGSSVPCPQRSPALFG